MCFWLADHPGWYQKDIWGILREQRLLFQCLCKVCCLSYLSHMISLQYIDFGNRTVMNFELEPVIYCICVQKEKQEGSCLFLFFSCSCWNIRQLLFGLTVHIFTPFTDKTFFFSPNSSTNAYMLIYRLKDPSRNASKKFIQLNLLKIMSEFLRLQHRYDKQWQPQDVWGHHLCSFFLSCCWFSCL